MFTLKLNDKEVLKTKSYRKLYKYLEKALSGGLSYGIDLQTLNALGYKVVQS